MHRSQLYGAPLTRTEEAIVELVLRGLAARKVARETGRTLQNVKNILRMAYKKLGVDGAPHLIAEAYSQQALLLWTEERGFYANDPRLASEREPAAIPPPQNRPSIPPQPWEKKFCVRLTPNEVRIMKAFVDQPDRTLRMIAPLVHMTPSSLSNAFAVIREKAGVVTQTGLLAFAMKA